MPDADLTVRPCRSLCAWEPARHARTCEVRGSLPLFRCRGCGSEWVRSEPWAPIDVDGGQHPVLVQELRRRAGHH
ncbi:MAG: hypothetical protein QOJ32_1323 [Frankiaceae bacterium]|jgi:hypothetical protein|nr:hypothetical protein [Frankiaceae bacterium]MDQ1672663.1 hypothetical protein [Frankiaceae bacterium]